MICPHCNKEVDGYISIKADNGVNLNLNNGCAGGILTTWVTNTNIAAANLLEAPYPYSAANVAGCANQGLNVQYYTL